MTLKKPTGFATAIGVSDGAPRLGFRVFSDEVRQLPELAFAFGEQNPGYFVGTAMVDHDFDDRAVVSIPTQLLENEIGARSVVNDTEGIDQIVGLDRDKTREF